jgi:hypothetical protein
MWHDKEMREEKRKKKIMGHRTYTGTLFSTYLALLKRSGRNNCNYILEKHQRRSKSTLNKTPNELRQCSVVFQGVIKFISLRSF